MTRAAPSSPTGTRLGVGLLVAALHAALLFALIRAFAPNLTKRVADEVVSAFTVREAAPTRPPATQAAKTEQVRPPDAAGAAADARRRARARPLVAPVPRLAIATSPAAAVAPVPGKGTEQTSGTSDAGTGSGAGGQGLGQGAGAAGRGQGGGGGAAKAVKIAGDINSTRDYPAASRDLRRGDYVILALTIGTDGRVKGCRVHRASRDAEADRVTCRLATERFRFRPAADAAGVPIESVFGWQQRWFDPGEK